MCQTDTSPLKKVCQAPKKCVRNRFLRKKKHPGCGAVWDFVLPLLWIVCFNRVRVYNFGELVSRINDNYYNVVELTVMTSKSWPCDCMSLKYAVSKGGSSVVFLLSFLSNSSSFLWFAHHSSTLVAIEHQITYNIFVFPFYRIFRFIAWKVVNWISSCRDNIIFT